MAKKSKSRYELKEKLGEGGMGVVWRAYDTVLNADVALKMLLDVTDANALKLFYDECNRQASLVHPNVIEIRDVGSFEEDGIRQPYLVMPLLRGNTLADLLGASREPLTVERCIDIFTQACRGLHAAHDHGLLHRDIKPSNVFILDDDSVKIIDFGIAHRLDVSRTIGRKGTLLYMSPEQLLLKPLTRASDVFSLAVVCYEVLTGKQPFVRASEEAIASALQHWNPPAASSLNPDVSTTLSQVLHKALAKLPAFRFSTAKEFGDTLRRAFYDTTFAVFDRAKFAPRLLKASEAFDRGDLGFAEEMVNELESEGYLTTDLQDLATGVRAAIQKRDVDQLLDSANARMQDGEYRLALQRVHEALHLDDRNPEALALRHEIEAKRAEADIVEWLDVGRQHLEKFSFSHARQAAQRILEEHPHEERAVQLLTQVERKKSEYQEIREQKQQVYAAALDAQRQNDLTSALSKMRQVLELDKQAPDLQEPSRSAGFESLYNKLHAEHEAVAEKYREAKQALDTGDYSTVALLCDTMLETYPQHTLFKALKYDNDQRWRRAISSQIIQVEEQADNEPDLDRRVSLLEEVVRDNPQIREFQNLLQAAQDKRDLVNGIVARAREFALREQFGEALVQWETLQTIHPGYPGLDFEIDNMRRRRALAERVALKKRWVNQINHEFEESRFAEALRLLSLALEDFPQDGELLEIEKGVRQQQRVAVEVEELIEEGRTSLEAGDLPEGLQKLREAHEIGSKNISAKTALIEGLLRAARARQDDPQQASSYLREILNLEPGNQAAQGMLRFLDDQMEHEQVDGSIFQARQLQTNTDFAPAIKLLQEAIDKYPRNTRLREVLREIESSQDEVRNHDLEVIRRKRLEADGLMNGPSIYRHMDAAKRMADRYKDDEEFQEESRLLQTRLQTMASATRTSVFGEISSDPRVNKQPSIQRPSGRIRRLWPASLAASLVLIVSAVSLHKVFLDKTTSQKPTQAAAKPAAHAPKVVAPPPATEHVTGTDAIVAPAPPKQQLQIAGSGSVKIDAQKSVAVENMPFSYELDDGQHQIEWTSPSGAKSRISLMIKQGEQARITHPLESGDSIPTTIVSAADQKAVVYSNVAASLQVDGQSKGRANARGLEVPVANGPHEFRLTSAYGSGLEIVEVGSTRTLAISFSPESNSGALIIDTNQPGVELALLSGGKTIRSVYAANNKLAVNNLPIGQYELHASKNGFQSPPDFSVNVERGRTAHLEIPLQQLVSISLHTLPQAQIVVDGKPSGTTDADGRLNLADVAAGEHRIEAHRHGKSSSMALHVSAATSQNPLELPLEQGAGTVLLSVTPPSAAVSVSQLDGKILPVSGTQFELAGGYYRVTARAAHFSDRTETINVVPEQTSKVDLSLTAEKPVAEQVHGPSLDGWDKDAWDFDRNHTAILHKKSGISLFSSQQSQGTYVFTVAHGDKWGTHGKNSIQWVAGYLDHGDYLLFSIGRDGFESFLVQNGNKIQHGSLVPLPKLKQYSISMNIRAQRVVTSVYDGQKWQPLQDWNNVLEDLNRGQFGFKDQLTVYTFQFAARN
ncbi:MAG TPA: protein kinase [Bryobacteraceae bacterium]|nr:protein kinase [Bryobacteraceae bacterium]